MKASSADQGRLAVYAARRTADDALTVVVINKTGQDLRSAVSLAGISPGGPAAVYTYFGEHLDRIVHGPDQPVAGSEFMRTFPKSSITLLEIPTRADSRESS